MSARKARCCRRFERKARACKDCPLMAGLGKKQQKKLLRKLRKKLAEAAPVSKKRSSGGSRSRG